MAVQGNGVTLGHISKPVQELCVLQQIAFTHQPLVGLHQQTKQTGLTVCAVLKAPLPMAFPTPGMEQAA